MRVGDVLDGLGVLLECGVVDQDRQLAERLHRFLHRALAEGRILHVATDQQAALAFRFHVVAGFGGVLVLAQVHHGHVGALAGKQHGHGATDTRVATGDDGSHAVQLAAAGICGCGELRPWVQVMLAAGFGLVLFRQRIFRLLAFAGLRRALLCRFRGFGGLVLFLAFHAALNVPRFLRSLVGAGFLCGFFTGGHGETCSVAGTRTLPSIPLIRGEKT